MGEFIDKKVVTEALYQALRTQIQGTFTDSMSLAIDMANNLPSISLEKQMIKVENITHTYGYPDEGICGFCHEEVNSLYNYCPECGMKLEWSEE